VAFVAHQRAGHGLEIGHGVEVLVCRRIEYVDGAVGGVSDIDVAGRGMDGGMVEAAGAGVCWQRYVSCEGERLGHDASRGPRLAKSRKASDSTLPIATRPAKVTMPRPTRSAAKSCVAIQPPSATTASRDNAANSGNCGWRVDWKADISVLGAMKM